MPLIIVTGYPSSGKTEATKKLKRFFEEDKLKTVHVVSENDILSTNKNSVLADSKKEKMIRGNLKSEVLRLINKDNVVILDALNYIKGFRYELYCGSKASKTTQCTVQCDVSPEDAWTWNQIRNDEERYSREVFDALVMRYEAPVGQNRWDSPLFLVLKDGVIATDLIHDALFLRKAPPPNQSTQCQPLSSTNFLFELDRVTKEIIAAILDRQKTGGVEGDSVKVPGTAEQVELTRKVTMAELARTKRQFITYAKARAIEDVDKLATMFVQYINTSVFA